MNKAQFLNELDRSLAGVAYADKQEIMSDYVEHFRAGLGEGKSEEEIAEALGNPRSIARAYKADYMVERARSDSSASNILRAILAVIGLGFFNLVVVLGPFLGMLGAIVGLWAAGIAIAVSGLAVLIGAACGTVLPWIMTGVPAAFIVGAAFIAVGLMAFGALWCIGMYFVTRAFCKLTVRYLDLNVRIIKGKEALS